MLCIMYYDIESCFGKNYILPTYNYDFPQKNLMLRKIRVNRILEFCRLNFIFHRSMCHFHLYQNVKFISKI